MHRALVSPQWVITATSCFASEGEAVASAAPTVTIGGTDPSGSGGRVLPVNWIHPHRDREVVLIRLALRVLDIAPVAVGATAPATGDALRVADYGRTAGEWAPRRPHTAPVVTGSVAAGSFGWTGADGGEVSACQGDAGAPVVRTGGSGPELVGLSIDAGQGGCLGAAGDGPRGAEAVRVDDLASWVRLVAAEPTTSFRAYWPSSAGIGGYELKNGADRAIALDHRSWGAQGQLFFYQPGGQLAWVVGRAYPPAVPALVTVRPAVRPDSILESFAYPVDFRHQFAGTSGQADWGTDEAEARNFELLSGNGGIIWVSCTASPENGVGVIKVFPGLLNGQTEVGEPHLGVTAVCFKVLAPAGYVKLRIPNVYEVQGDSRSPGAGHDVDATVVNVTSGTERTKRVERDESEQFGRTDTICDENHPDYPDNCRETLLELRVVTS
ncbi:trypsin-like serine protease [Nonomuraea sp. NPDC050783]|uniref:trypsin-like serine protease n=1 Tax=Nonomuraea sp. NPDC050783 TaxID=3154634 RepID=UPI0034678921